MTDTDPRLIGGERIVFTTSQHWAGVITSSLLAILLVLGSIVVAWVQPESTTGLIGFINRILELIRLGLFFGGVGWIIYNIVAWRTAEYSVTTLRVLGREGLIRRRSTDTLLTSIADIKTVTPALGRALGYGNVRLLSAAGEAGRDTFHGMRRPEDFKRRVLEQKVGGAAAAPANAASPPAPAVASPVTPTIVQLQNQLASLRDAGVITPQEYEAKQAELLARSG